MTEAPQTIEVEKAVLGSILSEPEKVVPICIEQGITEEMFFNPAHAFLFKYFLWRANDKGWPLDVILVNEHLTKKEKIDFIGGPMTLVNLLSGASSLVYLDHHLEVLRDTYARRIMFSKLRELENVDLNADDLAALFKDVSEEASQIITPSNKKTISDQVAAFERDFVARAEDESKAYGILTGSPRLDELTLGLHKGTLTVVSGKPSTGKSVLMLQFVAEGLRQRMKSAVFSMEMGDNEVIRRLVCYLTQIEMGLLQKPNRMTKDELKKVGEAMEFISESGLILDERPALRFSQIEAKVASCDPDMIAVDYLQLMAPEHHQAKLNRSDQLKRVSSGMKELAKKYSLASILGSQLNDKGQTKDTRGPEEDGDVNLRTLSCGKDDEDPTVYALKLDKNRNGQRFIKLPAFLDGARQRMIIKEEDDE